MILEYRLCVVKRVLLEAEATLDRFVRVELSGNIINDSDFDIRGAAILTRIKRGRFILNPLDRALLT